MHLPPVQKHQRAHLQTERVAEGLQLPARGGAHAGAWARRGGLLPAVRVPVRGAQHHHHQGDHRHLPVGGGRPAAVHGLPDAGGPADPQARRLHRAAARGGERGCPLRGRRRGLPGGAPCQHGAGARGGRAAALEAAGAGAEEDGVRPAQDAQLGGAPPGPSLWEHLGRPRRCGRVPADLTREAGRVPASSPSTRVSGPGEGTQARGEGGRCFGATFPAPKVGMSSPSGGRSQAPPLRVGTASPAASARAPSSRPPAPDTLVQAWPGPGALTGRPTSLAPWCLQSPRRPVSLCPATLAQ